MPAPPRQAWRRRTRCAAARSESHEDRRFHTASPVADMVAASHRLASYQSDPQEAKANRRKRRQTARANTPNAAFSVPIVV
jgi:hypothetical protein